MLKIQKFRNLEIIWKKWDIWGKKKLKKKAGNFEKKMKTLKKIVNSEKDWKFGENLKKQDIWKFFFKKIGNKLEIRKILEIWKYL